MKITPVEGYYSYVKRDGRINKKKGVRESSIRAANRDSRMKSIHELQQICLRSRKKQDELFETDLKYFIDNIGKQIEENAEKGIDTTEFWIAYGDCDIGEGYIKHTQFQDVESRLEEYFTNLGFEAYVFGGILKIKLPSLR